jgi:hypothetical protein
MAVPAPEPGLVINHAYLWHHEHTAGQEEGRKDRPAVIVLRVESAETGGVSVIVLPVTHREPEDQAAGLEIPAAVKRHLGLDAERSWIIVSEGNEFVWPGYDLRPRSDGNFTFGFLPPRLFKQVTRKFVAFHRKSKRSMTARD